MNKSTCCIHECGKPMYAKYICNTHYIRLRNTGTTDLRPFKPQKCRMPGCEKASRKNRWCSSHWSRIKRNGSPFDKDQSWVPGDFKHCLNCGDEFTPSYGRRRYCTGTCATTAHLGPRPRSMPCVQCGDPIDMTARGPSGRRKYRSATTCRRCSGSPNLTRFVPLLVDRDGTDCHLCGEAIDLSLVYPHPRSKSVDHVIPRSLGGPDDMSNYRLSCLTCNVRKNNRILTPA